VAVKNCVICGKFFRARAFAKTCPGRCYFTHERQKKREYARRYRAAHPEKYREKRREAARRYYAAHREKRREAARRYYAAHREKLREAARRYRAAHPEKDREKNREKVRRWRAAHPEKNREYSRRYSRRYLVRRTRAAFALSVLEAKADLLTRLQHKETDRGDNGDCQDGQ